MPPPKRPPPQDHDDVWAQRSHEIRELYQVQRKTLREVKETMERLGFPIMPLSTWETKLRDVLEVRKKVKSSDWPTIYRHVLPRLERPGKKKLKRPTSVYLNNTAIPWEKAWKEVRRSGVLSCSAQMGSLSPLPTYISIRTPSPFQSAVYPPGVMRSPSPFALATQTCQPEVVVPRSPPQISSPYADVAMFDFKPDELRLEIAIDSEIQSLFFLSRLQSIPWLQVSRVLKECFSSVENISIFNSAEYIGMPMYLVPWSLEACYCYEDGFSVKGLLDTTADTATVQNYDAFHYMSTTIYLPSNRLVVMEGEALVCLLETLRDHIPRNLLMEMFKTPLPAMRAAWELMIGFEVTAGFDGLFNLLVDIGIENEWLNVEEKGHDYLYYAVRAKSFDAMDKLLIHGCRADSGWLQEKDSAILKAIQGGHLVAAKLLMRNCDVNRNVVFYRDVSTVGQSTNFAMFMYEYNDGDFNHRRGLELFGENGAESNAPWFDSPFEPRRNPAMLDFYKLNNIPFKWWPTILDYFFYTDRSVYYKLYTYTIEMNQFSAAFNWRPAILLDLQWRDTQGLGDRIRRIDVEIDQHQKNPADSEGFPHLGPRPLHTSRHPEGHPLIELLFIEQFLFGGVWYKDKVQPRWNWYLLSLEIDLNLRSLPNKDMTEFLCVALALITTTCDPKSGIKRILYASCSLHRDSINWSEVFRAVVRTNSTEVFRLFAEMAPDPSQNGASALLEAARTDNYRAIDWLLALGVDIQSLATTEDHYTARNLKPRPRAAFSAPMIEFLSRKGLHVESEVAIFDPLLELKNMLTKGSHNLLQGVKYLLRQMRDLKHHEPDFLSSYLLELCLWGPDPWEERQQRLEVFEFCYLQGASLSPGSPLSVLIYAGGRTELIQDLLNKGAEVNAFSHDMDAEFPKLSEPWSLTPLQSAASCGNEIIVHVLLERGADVNAPALGRLGKTALQSICAWIPSTSAERARKTRIIHLLLERGADVNAAPADWCGRTALQIAAKAGELELVALLLHHGADVNAPPCPKQGYVALDRASFEGRLDVVKLLLESGARSFYGGSTGYDGAIDLAKHRGHFATAHLIEEHVREVALYHPSSSSSRDC